VQWNVVVVQSVEVDGLGRGMEFGRGRGSRDAERTAKRFFAFMVLMIIINNNNSDISDNDSILSLLLVLLGIIPINVDINNNTKIILMRCNMGCSYKGTCAHGEKLLISKSI